MTEQDALERIMALVQFSFQQIEEFNKAFWQEVMTAVTESNALRNEFVLFDQAFIKEIDNILTDKQHLEINLIYDVSIVSLMKFIYIEELKSEEILAELKLKIEFIISRRS